jgi:hypothetical protein
MFEITSGFLELYGFATDTVVVPAQRPVMERPPVQRTLVRDSA